ncbi:unnamed protein product [Cladocopium goreaui]|uniref:Uncharacterized protein n=1 Tax=Cladocopium goreaui TaxID=2562237 RepID=A0A9P1BUQ9_9DINO|nr:unnamed protein product [Cladocopium goreaui]
MQLDKLNSESNAANLHYMGIFLDDDTAMSVKTAGNVAGKLMSSWIPDLVRNKYSSSHASGLATFDELINTDKSVTTALKRSDDHSARAAPASGTSNDPGSGVQTRTLASPDFDGADVPNFDRVVVFDSTPLDEFNATKTLHCSSTLPGSTIVIAKVQNDGSWWLLNDGTDDVTLATNKELFGFNTGSFNEVPAGEAGSLIDQIPWLVQSDLDVICLCEQNGSALSKTLMTIADAVCNITRTQGATEACMLDHDMAPLTKTGENNEIQPLQFRYSISPKSKVNAFKPKPVDPAVDVRYSMLGGCFQAYNTLLRSRNVGTIWEVWHLIWVGHLI